MSRQGLGARPPRAISPQTQSPRHLDALLHQNGGDSSDKRRIRSRNAAPFRSGLHCVRDVALWIGKESYTCHICNMMNDIIHQKQCQ